MTTDDLLDSILKVYLYRNVLKLKNDPKYKRLTFDFIVRSQDPKIEDWHAEYSKETLLGDGFLKKEKVGGVETLELTPEGRRAAQNGWYNRTKREQKLNDEIKRHTLTTQRRSRHSLAVSISALIISTLISIYSLWSKQGDSLKAEIAELKLRLDKIEDLANKPSEVPGVSKNANSDTLKAAGNGK